MRLAAPLIVLLAGCTTTASDLRSHTPTATFTTTKPVAEVAQCLAESVSKIGAPSIFQGAEETTITFTQQAATTLFISISKTGEGRVWRVNALISYRGALDRCA